MKSPLKTALAGQHQHRVAVQRGVDGCLQPGVIPGARRVEDDRAAIKDRQGGQPERRKANGHPEDRLRLPGHSPSYSGTEATLAPGLAG